MKLFFRFLFLIFGSGTFFVEAKSLPTFELESTFEGAVHGLNSDYYSVLRLSPNAFYMAALRSRTSELSVWDLSTQTLVFQTPLSEVFPDVDTLINRFDISWNNSSNALSIKYADSTRFALAAFKLDTKTITAFLLANGSVTDLRWSSNGSSLSFVRQILGGEKSLYRYNVEKMQFDETLSLQTQNAFTSVSQAAWLAPQMLSYVENKTTIYPSAWLRFYAYTTGFLPIPVKTYDLPFGVAQLNVSPNASYMFLEKAASTSSVLFNSHGDVIAEYPKEELFESFKNASIWSPDSTEFAQVFYSSIANESTKLYPTQLFLRKLVGGWKYFKQGSEYPIRGAFVAFSPDNTYVALANRSEFANDIVYLLKRTDLSLVDVINYSGVETNHIGGIQFTTDGRFRIITELGRVDTYRFIP